MIDGPETFAGPGGRPRSRALVGGVLLAVVAVLAVIGSFGALMVQRHESDTASWTATWTGWTLTSEPPSPDDPGVVPPLDGILLVIGAVLALVSATLLLTRARRPGDRARLLGVAACGLLAGAIVSIWLELLAARSNTSVFASLGAQRTVDAGAGAWLLLIAGIMALTAAGILLVPLRPTHGVPSGWPAPPPPWEPPPAA